MNQEETEEKEYLYRVVNRGQGGFELLKFPIIKKTPRGNWIELSAQHQLSFDAQKTKWVGLDGRVFAFTSEFGAFKDYHFKKKWHAIHAARRAKYAECQRDRSAEILDWMQSTGGSYSEYEKGHIPWLS